MTTYDYYSATVTAIPSYDPAEEPGIIMKASQGDLEAQKQLVYAHLKFVLWFVFRHCSWTNGNLMDYVQLGNISLIKASQKVRPELNTRFTTFLFVCLKRDINKHHQLSRYPKRSVHHHETSLVDDEGETMSIPDPTIDLDEPILQTERRAWLEKWIHQLTPKEQAIMEAFLDGKPGPLKGKSRQWKDVVHKKIFAKLKRCALRDGVTAGDLDL